MLARTLHYSALAAMALSVAVIAGRALHGPFRIGTLPVNAPLNVQCIFGLCAVVLLLLNSTGSEPHSDPAVRRSVLWLLLILAVTAATLWKAAGFPFVFDEYTLAQYGHDMRLAILKDYFTQPGGDGFFRPIGYLSFGLDGLWAGHDPLRWRLSGLLLHLANITLVFQLARRVLADTAIALWAAAFFALHGTVLQTPTYLAARFDVLSVFFVLAGLALFLRYLDTPASWLLAASLICELLGMLTKETAYCFPLLAVVLAGRKGRTRGRALAGFFALAAAAFAYRFALFGGLGGYPGAHGISEIALGFLKGYGLRIWSAFWFPLNWSRAPEPWLFVLLLANLGAVAWLSLRARASRPNLLVGLAFLVLALLPLARLLLLDTTLLGAGRFYLALAGFALLCAAALQGLHRRRQILAGGLLIAFQAAALRHNEAIWGEIAALADRTCSAASQLPAVSVSGLPREIDGVPFLANGFDACVAFHQGSAHLAPSREFRWDPQSRALVPR